MSDKKTKILIVEDDKFVSDIYQTKLRNAGFEVLSATNGREALETLQKVGSVPELMLLDLIMPEVDGFKVLKSIKGVEKYKNMKTILLTNLSQEEDINEGMALGATDYLVKSFFTPQEVLDKINVHLNKP